MALVTYTVHLVLSCVIQDGQKVETGDKTIGTICGFLAL